ncbi:hypothetical protein A3B18_03255 [Candidatus Giovannonibacteria bacterium RIFCSPLOWO2_01_FULL_46_13]|uniref:Uncharacterized protein n=1 Tax=Candidatus Giovannonibacteria bacterium RIFCSPLOWO2_01_FULL_46_13 TaxID=1798352 RepID=A0A1F5X363_9BACT|nr:MAG: hypothetical protein A3B18_03255 [Candidatus Giovannonibacteria bacterium RIFCSPLOWO2_01_FULL_46_13]
MNQKGFINILLPIAVLIFVAIGAGIYFYSDKSANENIAQNNSDGTATWKTYENIRYGFSFKYPQELKEVASHPDSVFDLSLREGDIYSHGIEVSVIRKKFDPNDIQTNYAKVENPEIREFEGIKWYEYGEGDGGCRVTYNDTSLGNNTLRIGISRCEPQSANPYEDDAFLDKFLSTFKLVPIYNVSAETADWNIYTNLEYKFEFKYPKEWSLSFLSGGYSTSENQAQSWMVTKSPYYAYEGMPYGCEDCSGFFVHPTSCYPLFSNFENAKKDRVVINGVPGEGYTKIENGMLFSSDIIFPLKFSGSDCGSIEIYINPTLTINEQKEEENILEKILSTFRFIEYSDING